MPETITPLDSGIIKNLLAENGEKVNIYVYESIDSTNTEAKRLFENNSSNMLVCAEMQTAGRGRHGRSFYSPDRTGIYMSIAVHRNLPLVNAARATTAAAVAVCEAIEELTDKTPQIKWVNDVFVDGKKICGILTEAVLSDKKDIADGLIIGIGINTSTAEFPAEIKNTAGSLNTEKLDRNILVAGIYKKVLEYTLDLENPKHIEKYKERCFVLGREVSFEKNGEIIKATAFDIDKNGGLEVKTADGKVLTLKSGEISIKI